MNNFDLFDKCKKINSLFNDGNDNEAREEVINLLDFIQSNNIDLKEEPIGNIQFFTHLIRKSGIYPYLEKYIETAIFEDKLVYSLFNININNEEVILHREQLKVLNLLLKNKNVLLSAPTSFGKSYIIDALISIKKPKNVLIIVPTIALLDETRRRIYSKFQSNYNIITTSNQEIKPKNIFILTQERALSYIKSKTEFNLDLFIVDEFYKINDKDDYRSSILQRVVLYFKNNSKQQYFLCPNVYDIKGIFIEGMKFEKLIDFKTVIHNEEYIENIIEKENISLNEIKNIYYKNTLYNKYPPDFKKIYKFLNKYIDKIREQNLIYVYKVSNIAFISNILVSFNKYYLKNDIKHDTENFVKWVIDNYTNDWYLIDALQYGIGIHNGRIHRFLAQIQVNLFNKKNLNTIVATSSIIEGVNTEIKNIFLWDMRESNKKIIKFFKYKNIVGRAGRMNKYFKSNAYRLTEKIFKPKEKDLKINIEINTQTLFDYKDNLFSQYMTDDMKIEIDNFQNEMIEKIGNSEFYKITNENLIKNDRKTILDITNNLSNKKQNDINKLIEELKLFENEEWKNNYQALYYILKQYSNIVLNKLDINFNKNSEDDKLINISKAIIFISYNWDKSIAEIVNDLKSINLSIDDYFRIESFISFNLYSLFSDIDIIQKIILGDNQLNLSSFVKKLQNVFLPPHVYTLEEFGLPRMLSKIIDKSNIIKFDFNDNRDINKILKEFEENKDKIKELFDKNSFDYYILKYFYDGISVDF